MRSSAKYLFWLIVVLMSCGKSNDTPSNGGSGTGGGTGGSGTGVNTDTSCIISGISQVNSGSGTESSLSAFYNSDYSVSKLVVYDSVGKTKNFEADFNYINADSVSLNKYQYFILDNSKRVIHFKTKSDITDAENSDDYVFEYLYNSEGYLAKKNLYINNSQLPNFSTTYTYTNNLLTGCVMNAVSSGNLKVLESTLTYDNSLKIKNWIYTFPDAIEGYEYLTALNFGNRNLNPLKKVVTKIYDPPSETLLDTWTTDYSNYNVDAFGYVISGEATGDLQQGIAAFYGKTNFYYDCH